MHARAEYTFALHARTETLSEKAAEEDDANAKDERPWLTNIYLTG